MGDLPSDISATMVAHATKVEAAYQQVRKWILYGRLKPGMVLDQGALAAAVGVSTTPMREALRRLEAESLLTIQAHRRVMVSSLSVQDLEEIYDVRRLLDPLAASMAATRMRAAELNRLEELLRLNPAEAMEGLNVNFQFHAAIYEACGNAVLVQILGSLHTRAMRYGQIIVNSEDDAEKTRAEHQEIVDALRQRNSDEIAILFRLHLERELNTIRQALSAQAVSGEGTAQQANKVAG
jgi:DNA-binding GntR family transcriptional regulator